MKRFNRLVKDRVIFFALSVFFITILGATFVRSKYLAMPIHFPQGEALEGILTLSSFQVKVTQDTYNINKVNTVNLKIKIKNNTDEMLTGIKLVMGNKDLGYLESPSAFRFAYLSPKEHEIIFKLGNLPPQGTSEAQISVYGQKRGVYLIKADVLTDQKIRATSNTINSQTLTVE